MRDAKFFTDQTIKAFGWLHRAGDLHPDLKAMLQAQVALMCQVAYMEGRRDGLKLAATIAESPPASASSEASS